MFCLALRSRSRRMDQNSGKKPHLSSQHPPCHSRAPLLAPPTSTRRSFAAAGLGRRRGAGRWQRQICAGGAAGGRRTGRAEGAGLAAAARWMLSRTGEEGFGRQREARGTGRLAARMADPAAASSPGREVKENGERDEKKMGWAGCCFPSGSKAHIIDSC
jgi:hypothetical protein